MKVASPLQSTFGEQPTDTTVDKSYSIPEIDSTVNLTHSVSETDYYQIWTTYFGFSYLILDEKIPSIFFLRLCKKNGFSREKIHNFFSFLMFLLTMQEDQLNMVVLFWYLVKSYLSSEHMYTLNIQVTFYKVPEKHGHV